MAALDSARARPLTTLAVVAGVVIFLLLLGGNAGVAVLVSILVVPAAILFYLTRLDLYEREPWALLASVVGAGALVGLLGGLLSTFFFERFWFSDSRLNLGAIGFSGVSANGEGSVPFGVILLSGILIPVLTGAAILGGPIALRRWPVFRNEITDGMTLGGLAAAGFATVSSFVYFWPSAFDDLPDRPVSQWTALLAGIVVVRPVVLILAGSLLGIAAWQYLSTKDIRSVLIPGVAGTFGWLALPLGSLLLAQSGAVTEFVWYAVVLVVVGVLFRQALGRSLAADRQVLAPEDGVQRVICPNCHRVTPEGSFCSFCRAPLHPEAPVALETAPSAGTVTPDSREMQSTDQAFTAPDSSMRGSSGQTPVMARQTPDTDEPPRTDPVADSADVNDAAWLNEVASEPEADAFDYVDETPVDDTSVDETATRAQPVAGSMESAPSRSSSPSDEGLPATSRFNRIGPDDQALDGSVTTNTGDFGSVDPHEDGGQPAPTDQSYEPNRPISLQDWSRRSEPTHASETDDSHDDHDQERLRASTQSGSSPWKRSAETASEPVSGLKWPTSAAAATDQSDASVGFPDSVSDLPDGEGSPIPPHRSQLAGGSEQRPVASSSGRWFDASTSLGGSTPTVPSPESPGQPLEDDSTTPPDDSAAMGIDDDPARNELTEPVEDFAEPDLADEQEPPSGLRWYRQDDPDDHFEAPADDEPEPPVDARDWASDLPESTESPAPTTDTDPTSAVGTRPGIWRSFTRQGRGATPRAPQRDHGQTDDES